MTFGWLRFWKKKSLKKTTFNELQELEKAASVISNQRLNGKQRIEKGIYHLMIAKVHEERLKALLKDAGNEETVYQERFRALFNHDPYATLTDDQKRLMGGMHKLIADLKAIDATITGDEKRVRVDIDKWIALLQLAKQNLDRKGNIGDAWDKTLMSVARQIKDDIAVCDTELKTRRINEISLARIEVRLEYSKRIKAVIEAYDRDSIGISDAAKRELDKRCLAIVKQLRANEREKLDTLDKQLNR